MSYRHVYRAMQLAGLAPRFTKKYSASGGPRPSNTLTSPNSVCAVAIAVESPRSGKSCFTTIHPCMAYIVHTSIGVNDGGWRWRGCIPSQYFTHTHPSDTLSPHSTFTDASPPLDSSPPPEVCQPLMPVYTSPRSVTLSAAASHDCWRGC